MKIRVWLKAAQTGKVKEEFTKEKVAMLHLRRYKNLLHEENQESYFRRRNAYVRKP